MASNFQNFLGEGPTPPHPAHALCAWGLPPPVSPWSCYQWFGNPLQVMKFWLRRWYLTFIILSKQHWCMYIVLFLYAATQPASMSGGNKTKEERIAFVKQHIGAVPDFPKQGILFRCHGPDLHDEASSPARVSAHGGRDPGKPAWPKHFSRSGGMSLSASHSSSLLFTNAVGSVLISLPPCAETLARMWWVVFK